MQAIIKRAYPSAHFVHCYAHKLNLILQKATSVNRNVRVFFSSLSGVSEFFSKLPQCMASLENATAGRRIPRPSSTRWNFWSRTVNSVHEIKSEIIQCCSNLETSPTQETGFVATGIKNILQNLSFEYWLNLFAKIMPHVKILFHQMQSRQINAVFARNCVKNFEIQINKIRNNIGVANDQSSSIFPKLNINKHKKQGLMLRQKRHVM